MASSDTEIANFALSHLGVSKPIGNLTTESSAEAVACRRFYANTRDEMLRSFNWPFARQCVALGLVESNPTDEWQFSYRYPSDCLMVRRMFNSIRNPTQKSAEKYWIARDATGLLIYTDLDDASAEYTIREEDVLRFPPDFVIALSYRLASYVAPLITRGDPFKLAEKSVQLYRLSSTTAAANALNEQRRDEFPDPSLIEARN